MTVGKWITAILVFLLAGAFLVLSVRHFMEKGFLLNNAYLYASEKERKAMNKKPYYRQSAIVFCLFSAVFLVIGLSLVLQNPGVVLLEIPLMAAAILYAIGSAVRIQKQKQNVNRD